MYFSNQELELAQLFKAYGMPWEPTCGHYVLDQAGLIECASPFQDRVFFILDLKHFLRRSETLDNLQDAMCWLPTWEQARSLLGEWGVSASTISLRLADSDAFEQGTERLELYRLIEEQLTTASA